MPVIDAGNEFVWLVRSVVRVSVLVPGSEIWPPTSTRVPSLALLPLKSSRPELLTSTSLVGAIWFEPNSRTTSAAGPPVESPVLEMFTVFVAGDREVAGGRGGAAVEVIDEQRACADDGVAGIGVADDPVQVERTRPGLGQADVGGPGQDLAGQRQPGHVIEREGHRNVDGDGGRRGIAACRRW